MDYWVNLNTCRRQVATIASPGAQAKRRMEREAGGEMVAAGSGGVAQPG